jgi:nucleotide-binding universal stress UspA family protein
MTYRSAAILVGIVGTASADAALRAGLDRADACGAPACVVCAGPASAADDAFLRDLIERWAEKYPRVRVTTRFSRSIDAAVTLTAESRSCRVVVLTASTEPAVAAVATAVARRAHCPVLVADAERLLTPAFAVQA